MIKDKVKHKRYTDERNKLIPTAERFANSLYGVQGPSGRTAQKERLEWCTKWTCAFLGEMDRLARLNGLTGGKNGSI